MLRREVTKEEQAAIARLRRALRGFPDTLLLHAGTGGLNVVLLDPDREPYTDASSRWNCWDRDGIAASIDVRADGGDPW